METCVIIDYGSGNLRSAAKAFERAAEERGLAVDIKVTGRPEDVRKAGRIVLPGVGAYADCRRGLDAVPGLIPALEDRVRCDGRPFLGICVGMQLMATRGREFMTTPGLGWIGGDVVVIRPSMGRDMNGEPLKVPHMGWNDLRFEPGRHPLLHGLKRGDHGYFVHSFRFDCAETRDVLATVEYGGEIAAVVGRDNVVGTQFHPEKSQKTGLHLIGNFLAWRP